MTIPIEVVHKSDIVRHKGCPKQTQFEKVWNIQASFINESSVAGSAFHDTVEDYHRMQMEPGDDAGYLDNAKFWFEKFVKNFHGRKAKITTAGIKINTVEDIKAEDFALMINGYIKKPYNRYAEPILIETPFYFEIRRGRRWYKFAGTIDQLLKINVKYLHDMFPYYTVNDIDINDDTKKSYLYIHRDIKTGKKGDAAMLEVSDDINLYAYALAFGAFDLDGDGVCEKVIGLLPFAHAIYYTRDLIPYIKSGRRGDKTWKAGEDRGSGMYFVKRTYEQLKAIEDELIEDHKFVNSGIYPRIGKLHNRCISYCAHKEMCWSDLKGEM